MIDAVLLIVMLIGLIVGWWKGFFLQLASLVGAVVGFFIACFLYASFGDMLAPHLGSSPTMSHIVAFLLLWILVPLAFTFVGHLATGIFEKIKLGWLNHLLGALLGLFKFMLFTSLFLSLFEFANKYDSNPLIEESTKEKSYLYYPVQRFVGSLLPSTIWGDEGEDNKDGEEKTDKEALRRMIFDKENGKTREEPVGA